MRLSVALIAISLASCGKQLPTLDAEYRDAQRLLYSEKYDLALTKSRAGLARADQDRTAAHQWQFRILQTEVLLGQRRAKEAGLALDGYGYPPEGAEWAETRGRLLLLQGRVHYAQARYDKAAAAFDAAAEIAQSGGFALLAAEVQLRQGLLRIHEGRLDDARALFQELTETARNAYLKANAAGNVGFVLQEQRRYEDAIPWFERAISLFDGVGAAESAARNHGNLASCYWGLGDYDNARLQYQIAQDGFAKTGNLDSQQIWLGNASNIPYEIGDYATAEKGYQRALEIARKVPNQRRVGLWLANLAATSVELAKWDAASGYNAEALPTLHDAQDRKWDLMLTVNAARIEEGRGHFDKARELFASVLKSSGEDPSSILDAHAGLARLQAREGNTGQAETEFRSALAMIEKSRSNLVKDDYKVSYLASLIRFHREYVDFLISNHQPERALEVADASRARLLEEKSVTAHTTADYRRVAKQMHATLLEYLLGPQKSYLWVIRADGVRMHELPSREQIRALVESYRAVVTSGRNPLDVAGSTGKKLYEMLLAPGVNGPGRFIVVPDQDLYSFNMETLPAKPGTYWIEDATMAMAPSLNYLAGRTGGRTSHALLAIGDATSSSKQYPKLEFAGQELDSIAAQVREKETTVLRGEEAKPANYLAGHPERYGYIHFAAHAAANQQSPLDSAVILSGPVETSRLLARQVMAVPLTAELVTISACRSAGGKTYAGEGLVGFAWAFLRAGAHNVIAGLWDVSDRSTAQLMTGLYGEIADGRSPADALRAAKLQLIHGGGAYAKPFYWAPFQLYAGTTQ